MITFFELIVIFQIIIEAVPISSSGHCTLLGLYAQKYFNTDLALNDDLFSILSIPTLITLAVVFWHDWTSIFVRLVKTPAQIAHGGTAKAHSFQWIHCVAQLILFAIISDFLSLLLEQLFKLLRAHCSWLSSPWLFVGGFMMTSLMLLSLRLIPNGPAQALSPLKAVLIGLAQGLALLPGVSRFATTFVVGRWLGLTARHSILYSFTMHVGIILGAFTRMLLTTQTPLLELWQPFFTVRMVAIVGLSTLASIAALHQVYLLALADKLWWLGFYMLAPISLLLNLLLR